MTLDSGTLSVWRGANSAPSGGMPVFDYEYLLTTYYAERTVGVTRYYSAQQYGERPDILVRIPRTYQIQVGNDVVRLNPYSHIDENEYSVLQVQQILDEDGLPVTELSLQITEVDDESFA